MPNDPDAPATPPPTPLDSPVATDLRSDALGGPRADPPLPPPPGTVEEGFWSRSATQGAIVTTVALLLTVARSFILNEPVSRESLAMGLEAITWAWLAAVGLHSVGPASLRAK